MKKVIVSDVEVRVNGSWAASSGSVGVSIKYSEDGKSSMWLTGVETENSPIIYLSDEYIFDKVFFDDEKDYEEEDYSIAGDLYEKYHIDFLSDIKLGGYEEILKNTDASKDIAASKLMAYLIIIMRCKMEDLEKYIELGKGKNISDLELIEIAKDVVNY